MTLSHVWVSSSGQNFTYRFIKNYIAISWNYEWSFMGIKKKTIIVVFVFYSFTDRLWFPFSHAMENLKTALESSFQAFQPVHDIIYTIPIKPSVHVTPVTHRISRNQFNPASIITTCMEMFILTLFYTVLPKMLYSNIEWSMEKF